MFEYLRTHPQGYLSSAQLKTFGISGRTYAVNGITLTKWYKIMHFGENFLYKAAADQFQAAIWPPGTTF